MNSKPTLAQALAVLAVVGAFNAPAVARPQNPALQERTPRSAAALRAFKRAHPCPATGRASGERPCPGFIVDHVVPLCAGGADAPANMQWQTTAEAKKKDREEHAQCRAIRKRAK